MRESPCGTLREVFDRVHVINLRERADRRRAITAELAELGEVFAPGRVEIVEGIRVADAGGFPSPGNRGCFLSHKLAIRRAAEAGARNVLVCEDDAQFSPEMKAWGRRMLSELIELTWDIAFLGHGGAPDPGARGEWRPLTERGFGMHCYAVNGRCFDALLRYMELTEERPVGHPQGAKLGADALYTMFAALHSVKVIQAWPSLARQRSSASSISPRWFDRVTGLRTAALFARNIVKR